MSRNDGSSQSADIAQDTAQAEADSKVRRLRVPRRPARPSVFSSWRTAWQRRRTLRRDVSEIVDSMPIPVPFDLDQLISNIEAARGRRIILMPVPDHLLGSSGVCGLWLKHQNKALDVILHVDSTSAYHRQQIILHELVHLWADDADGVTEGEMDDLVAGLPSALVDRLIGRNQVAARRRYESYREVRTEAAAARINEAASFDTYIEDTTARRLAADFAYPCGNATSTLRGDHNV
ncbi:hypothetical protein ACWEN4_19360 [Streptomyces violaceorubidus]|uniref:hypothetical protein n=1 Tax=Streptomyces sp. x-45 TaxID=2789281 RepID=UPI0039812888